MKILIVLCLLVLFVRSHYKTCRATGDPHFTTFYGTYFDQYSADGLWQLAKHKGGFFSVQTVTQFHHPWANRALQIKVAVRIGNHLIESFGGSSNYNPRRNLKIDGKLVTIPFGTRKLSGGKVFVSAGFHNNYSQTRITSPANGVTIIINAIHAGNRFMYHDIYITIPGSMLPHMGGLCAIRHRGPRNPIDNHIGNRWGKIPSNKSIFGKKFFFHHGKPPKRMGHIPWSSIAYKNQVQRYCDGLGLKNEMYHDCVYDCKLAGSLAGCKGYANSKHSMNEIMRMSRMNGKGPLHVLYVLSVKMRKDIIKEINNAKSLIAKSQKELRNLINERNKINAILALSRRLNRHRHHRNRMTGILGIMLREVNKGIQTQQNILNKAQHTLKEAQHDLKYIRQAQGEIGKLIVQSRNEKKRRR